MILTKQKCTNLRHVHIIVRMKEVVIKEIAKLGGNIVGTQ